MFKNHYTTLANVGDIVNGVLSWVGGNWETVCSVLIVPIVVKVIVGSHMKRKSLNKPSIKTRVTDYLTKRKYDYTRDQLDKVRRAYDSEQGQQDPNDPINSTALELQNQVQGYIEYLLDAISGADRVVIHKFHNGGKYHTGVSTQKIKLTYEATKKKGRRIDNELNQPDFVLEKMGGILKKLVDDRYLYLTINKDREAFGSTPYFQIMEDDDVASNHLSILRSNGQWRNIGVLSIHFFSTSKKELSAREKMIISKARRDIALLLVGDTKGYPRNHI